VLAAGASSGSDTIQYEGEEIVFCESGCVTFLVGKDEYTLEPGDSLHFRANIPHPWENRTAFATRFTITGTHPLAFRSLIQSRVSARTELGEPRPHLEPHSPISLAG